jgi:hypothetical protein
MKTIITKLAQKFGIQPYPFEAKGQQYEKILKDYGVEALEFNLQDAREAERNQEDIERAGGTGVDKDYQWRRDDVLTICQVFLNHKLPIPPRKI